MRAKAYRHGIFFANLLWVLVFLLLICPTVAHVSSRLDPISLFLVVGSWIIGKMKILNEALCAKGPVR